MPSDANGVYTLPEGYLAVTGETVLASEHNPPLEDLAESMTQRVMASGAKPFTGPAKLADGTVSAPALAFASATSSGMYKTADGYGFSVGGAMVAEFTTGGIRTGARYLGELIPFTGLTAPSLTVLPYGQTLSRTTYAALWAFAQIEIAAGNTLYNNGNGSTTFGIMDLRGRGTAGKDNMGGVAANRLTSTYFGADAKVLGNVGGLESNNVILTHNHAITDPGHVHVETGSQAGSSSGHVFTPNNGTSGVVLPSSDSTSSATTGITINNSGSASAHNIVQPTIITNYILFAGA